MLLTGLLLGLATDAFRVSRANAERTRELAELRVSFEQAREAMNNAVVQRDQLKDEADRLRQWSEEVHRLRAEVSRLKSEAAQSQVVREQMSRAAMKTEAAAAQAPDKLKARESALSIDSAPPLIQAALLRESGGLPAKGALGIFNDKEGRPTYGFKGQSNDGRAMFLRMGEDGAILEKSVEIPANTVPVHIQTPAAQVFNGVAITGAREILDGGNVRYELSARGPDSGMQVTVRSDGTILGYSAKFQQTEQEQPKQKVQK